MERTELIRTIGKLFSLPGELLEATPLTVGNINETYTVTYRESDGSEKQYIFQRLNTNVFTEPERVMENIEHVTEYLRKEYPEECSVRFYHTQEGLNYAFSGANSVYRVMDRIDGVNISKTDDLSLVRACGKGFGAFQSRLSELDASLLYETIPNFHNTGKRYEVFSEAVREDKVGRLSEVQAEVDALLSVKEKVCYVSDLFYDGRLPLRVTHNDTKCNNIMFDRETGEPLAVIDLDTVMPGCAAFDFGDGIRFIANSTDEDERDTSKCGLDIDKYRAFSEGFIQEVKENLTEAEILSFPMGAVAMTGEVAVRFLTDYLNGDVYFKTRYPDHNLVRARNQIALLTDMLRKEDEMKKIVEQILQEES